MAYLPISDILAWFGLDQPKVQVIACNKMKKLCFEIDLEEILASILIVM